jgi:hypothetical protein
METSKDLAEIIRTIGSLAHQLGLRVIAEGIENEEQLDLIRSLNCEYGQGFLFSRPVDSEKAGALLKTGLPQRPGTDSGNANARDGAVTAGRPSLKGPQSTVADPQVKWPLIGQIQRKLDWRVGPALIISIATILLLAGGAIIKFAGRTYSPPAGTAQSSPQNMVKTPGSAVTVEKPSGMSATPGNQKQPAKDTNRGSTQAAPRSASVEQKRNSPAQSEAGTSLKATSGKAATAKSAPPRSLTKDPAAPTEKLLTGTFPVVHDHVLGSCKGILKITRNTLSFIPERQKDGFAFKYDEFTYASSNDQLTIKSGSKTFRFRSAMVRNKDENRSQIQNIVRCISTIHPAPPKK